MTIFGMCHYCIHWSDRSLICDNSVTIQSLWFFRKNF